MMKELPIFLLLCIAGCVIIVQGATPTITDPKVAKVHYITRDENIELSCKADGDPVYRWLRDGKQVEAQDLANTGQHISFDSRSGTLTIKKFDNYFSGDYVCVATVGTAASMSQTQTLREVRFSKFKVGNPKSYSTDEYNYVKIECSDQGEIVSEKSDINYNWFFSQSTTQIPAEDRLFIDEEGNLHFTYALKTDETNNDKKYICGYSSKKVRQYNLGNNNDLTVTAVAEPTGSAPTLMYSNNGKVVGQIGSEAQLECFFAGYHTGRDNHLPEIKWFDNQVEITNSDKYELSKNNRVLKVKNLQESDEKSYMCQGFTANGNSKQNPVYLNVTSPPIWVRAPETTTKPEGKDAVFHCDARSASNEEPPYEPVWYKNAKKFGSDVDFKRFVFSADKKTLTVKQLTKPEDIMCVQCSVSNSIGMLMGDACLNVVKPIKITQQPPEEQNIKKGEIVYLTIKATADEQSNNPLTIEWTFNNQTYTLPHTVPPYVKHITRLGETYINTTELSRSDYEKIGGLYTGRVYNQFDTKNFQTNVVLQDVVPAPVAASAGFDMWIVGLIIGIVFLIIVIAIIIFVICRKQQEGDYNVDKKETGAGLDPEKELRDKGFNDLSRGDYDDYDYPEKKPRGDLEYDDVPIGDDESLGEYGDEEDTHFNEDGSFIGIYQKKENERQGHKAESTI